MATTIRQGAYTQISGVPASVMSTELNAAANGSWTISTAAFDNSVNLDAWGDFFLTLAAFGVAPTANTTLDLYILTTTDGGTTFPGFDSTNKYISPTLLACSFPVEAQTSNPVLVCRNIPIPPSKFKVVLVNNTGQSLAASGNTLTALTHSMQSG